MDQGSCWVLREEKNYGNNGPGLKRPRASSYFADNENEGGRKWREGGGRMEVGTSTVEPTWATVLKELDNVWSSAVEGGWG